MLTRIIAHAVLGYVIERVLTSGVKGVKTHAQDTLNDSTNENVQGQTNEYQNSGVGGSTFTGSDDNLRPATKAPHTVEGAQDAENK